MFLLSIIIYGYNWIIGLLMGNDKDKKYTDKDTMIKMIMFGIILFLSIISTYYSPYIVYILISISK